VVPLRFSEARTAVRNPDARRRPADDNQGFPTPFPMASKAIRVLHQSGSVAARDYLESTIESSTYWGSESENKGARSWAGTIKKCMETYIEFSDTDIRPALGAPVSSTIEIAEFQLAMTIDVVLLDEGGYTARLPLWDKNLITEDIAAILATPMVLALERELGVERVTAVEIWHLRSRSTFAISRSGALARRREQVYGLCA